MNGINIILQVITKNKGKLILNGIEINNFSLSGNEWDKMVKNSKFANMSGFVKYK